MMTLTRKPNRFHSASFRDEAIDTIYLILGAFTHFYGISLTLLFFTHAADAMPFFVQLLDAFQDAYFAALGVYVVLKEIRKHRHPELKNRRSGEYFVLLWALLLVVSTIVVIVSPAFRFDVIYRLIVANSLSTLIIYIGAVVHQW